MVRLMKVARRIGRMVLPLRAQIRLGWKTLRASVDPLHPVLKEVASQKAITVLEIGARWGDSVRYIALHFPVQRYVAIDPFKSYDGYKGHNFNDVLQGAEDEIYQKTLAVGRDCLGDRFELIRAFSAEVADRIDGESVDFVFIDGNHRFQFVLDDLRNYWPKVAPGGYLCGHDYFMRLRASDGGYDEPMVYEAVSLFASETGVEVATFGEHRGFPMCFAIKKPLGEVGSAPKGTAV